MNHFFAKLAILLMTLILPSMADNRPNIVFIFSDDHAFQAIGAYGGRLQSMDPTPHLDKLAAEGMRFDRFYVGNSICAPSRATLLTGKHSHKNGKLDNRGAFDHDQQTFPKLLQKVGYQTAIVGKTHLKGDIQGFDYWETLPGQGNYYQPDFNTKDGMKTYEGYVTEITTDKSLDWLKNKRNDKKPFMLMIHQKAPHRSWCPPLDLLTKWDDIDVPEPDTLFDDYATRTTAAHKQDMSIEITMNLPNDLKVKTPEHNKMMLEQFAKIKKKRKGFIPGGEKGVYYRMTPEQRKIWDAAYNPKNQKFLDAKLTGKDLVHWKYQRYMKDYLRCIYGVDRGIGRVMDYLKENNLEENTIVIYSSDQGFYLGEHGWFDKRFMYEESFRTPFIVKWPAKIKAGSVNTDLCQNIDWASTFLDLANAEIPADMQGRSLVPLFKGKKPADWRTSLYYTYYEYPHGSHSVRKHEGVSTKRYKLIRFYGTDVPNGEEWEFYDLEAAPKEMNNSYNNPEYASKVKEMKAELQKLRVKYDAPELK